MTTRKLQLRSGLFLFLGLFFWIEAYAQITPLQDAYTNSADPTTNYGANVLLDVDGATQIAYIQFDLASVPATATISQATLKLYVNSVTTAGSFNVNYVTSAWTESKITANDAPTQGGAIASNVDVTTADKNQYILVNVTAAVQAWLSGSETNNGIALVANSSFNATFDSKENTTTSHPAELDIAFGGGDGTITGVGTAAGSGLTGGGTSGTLNLSLSTACTANQILQWNGSAWACTAAATGTITGVTGGTGLSGSGTSGNVTLNNTGILALTAGTGVSSTGGQSPTLSINTSLVPELSAANTFSKNLSTSGELAAGGTAGGKTANGTVEVDAGGTNTGTYSPGLNFGGGGQSIASDRAGTVNVKGIDFYTNFENRMSVLNNGQVGIGTASPGPSNQLEVDTSLGASVLGVSTNSTANVLYGVALSTSGDAWGVLGQTFSNAYDAYGVFGQAPASSGNAIGTYGQSEAPAGTGVFGQRQSESLTGQNLAGLGNFGYSGIGVWGDGGTTSNAGGGLVMAGVGGTADDGTAAFFANNSSTGYDTVDIYGINSASYPLYVSAYSGYCNINSSGDLTCSGTITPGTEVDGGARMVAMPAISSPVNWFEDAGESQLSNGAAVVTLDPDYIQTVNTGMKYQVFLTPYGNCKGLYVSKRTVNSFEVHELGGGSANVSFGYRIMAVRRNYENVRFADLTRDMNKMKQMRERMKAPGAKPVSHDPTRKVMPAAAKTASLAPSPEVRK